MGKGIGGFISGILGSENEEKAAAPPVDANAYNYGGYEGGATDAALRYRENAKNAQSREGVNANYDAANRMNQMGLQARGDMNQVGQAQLSRALGRTPSIAQMQADRQMQQATAAQAAGRASARGAAGLALAQQNAANNTANMQSNISGQAQINAAQERMQAEQAAAGTFANMQGLDAQRTGMAAQMSQYNATNQMQQRELNDRMTSDMLKNELAVQGMQLGASQNLQAQRSANSLGAAGINAGVGGQNAGINQQNGFGIVGAGAQVAGGLASAYTGGAAGAAGSVTGKADGGPVASDKPYLVGEHGPEVIVPKNDGMVIPSEVTVPMISTWGQQDRGAQKAAMDAAEAQGLSAQRSTEANKDYVDPYQRDLDRVRNLRAVAPGLIDDEDMRQERVARVRLRQKPDGSQAKEQAEPGEKQAVSEGKALPRSPLRRALGKAASGLGTVHDGATRIASGADIGYHGPTTFNGPQLIPVAPPRAMGGPMAGGDPYTVGENGPELVVPQLFGPRSHGATNDPTGGFTKLKGSGMDVMGTLKAQSDFATRFQRQPSTGPASPVTRANGGPVKKGQTALVGERGPEMVVDLDEYAKDGYDVGEGPGERDFDADEYLESKAPKPASFEDLHMKRDTKADQARVKKSVEDKAGKDADALMASFGKSLAMGPSVAVRDQDGDTKRIAAREEGGPVAGGQPAVVGEKGPEMVVPAEQKRAADQDHMRRMMNDPQYMRAHGRTRAAEELEAQQAAEQARKEDERTGANVADTALLLANPLAATAGAFAGKYLADSPRLVSLSAALGRGRR